MIRAERYSAEHDEEWDRLVEESANGCFLHTRRFYSYHAGRFRDASLLLYRKKKLAGVVPAAWRDGGVSSHPGCTFGGLVFAAGTDTGDVVRMVEEAETAWSADGAESVTVALPPWFAHRSPNQALEHALARGGYRPLQDTTSFLPLAIESEEALIDGYRSSTRGQLQQALRNGLTARESDDFAAFWRMLARNLADRHEADPVHSLDEILLLRRLLGDRIRLLGVFHEEEMICGSVLFDYGPALHTQYIATNYDHADLRPTNLLYHAFLAMALREGWDYASFGVSSEGFGGEVNAGLLRFKEGFGARPALVQRYARSLEKRAEESEG